MDLMFTFFGDRTNETNQKFENTITIINNKSPSKPPKSKWDWVRKAKEKQAVSNAGQGFEPIL